MRKSLLLILFLLAFAVPQAFGQQPGEQPAPAADITREDDRLPFMQPQGETGSAAEPSSAGLIVRALGAMLLVVGLIFFGAWGAKKLGFGSGTAAAAESGLAVVSTVSMGSGRSLSTIRFGDRTLLIGSTQQNITLLAEGDGTAPAGSPRSVAELLRDEGSSFTDEFDRAYTQRSVTALDGGQS